MHVPVLSLPALPARSLLRKLTAGAGLPVALCLLAAATARADPPLGYYDGVDTRSQAVLRATVHQAIKDHLRRPYTSDNIDTWDVLELADQDPTDPAQILDLYKNASYPKGAHSSYQREHAWPSSYGFPDDVVSNYPFTDCHALFLADASYNKSQDDKSRGNTLYRTCNPSCDERPTVLNHGRGGPSTGYPGNSNWRQGSGRTGTWEVWRGRRGDVARALFYMDVRYEGGFHGVTGVAEPDLVLTDDVSRIATSQGNAAVAYMGLLSVLLAWHREDPVDDLERRRNDVVAAAQGNRNPFVDHPEWVACAFTGDCSALGPPAAPSALAVVARSAIKAYLFWRDNSTTETSFRIERRTATGDFVEIGATAADATTFVVADLEPATTYTFRVKARGTGGDAASNEASVTTREAGAGVCDAPAVCFQRNRFLVAARWQTAAGAAGDATVVRLTEDSGYLWFFNPANVEAVFKLLDACPLNQRFWFFAGGLTNVETSITVLDTVSSAVKPYRNPQGTPFQPIQDTAAFATCP